MTKKKSAEPEDPAMTDAPPVPMSELEQLQFSCDKTTDDTLESTRRMLTLCEESKEAGIRTLVALDDQGEQLDGIEKGMDLINADMKEAEKALSGMEGCCWGLCVLPCQKSNNYKESNDPWNTKDEGTTSNQPRPMDNGVIMGGQYIGRITKDAREDEMEENMGQVNTMIDNLRNMAQDMGSEIETGNAQLTRIEAKSSSNEARIKIANQRASAMLKNA